MVIESLEADATEFSVAENVMGLVTAPAVNRSNRKVSELAKLVRLCNLFLLKHASLTDKNPLRGQL
jgi:hypothetical protein